MDPHRALNRVPASGHLKATGSPGRYGEAFPQGRHFALAHVQLAVGRGGSPNSLRATSGMRARQSVLFMAEDHPSLLRGRGGGLFPYPIERLGLAELLFPHHQVQDTAVCFLFRVVPGPAAQIDCHGAIEPLHVLLPRLFLLRIA